MVEGWRWPARWFLAVLVVIALRAGPVPGMGWAGEPSTTPVLRIEAGMHTTMIKRIDRDAAERLIVTVAGDKTARVWSARDGKLLRVLRPPLGEGPQGEENEGKLYAVAMSPDGTQIAVAGWTGLAWDNSHSIYIFASANGQIIARLTGLPDVIHHLSFSPDGTYLAAGLGGRKGVRVWQLANQREVLRDSDYRASSYGLAWAADGRLAATSYDGDLRLYHGPEGRRLARSTATGGKRPYGIAFTPDGQKLAVGYDGSIHVDILSGHDLTLLYRPDTSGVKNGDLSKVNWSADGQFLFAAGRWQDDAGRHPIRRWAEAGQGAFIDLPGASDTVMGLLPFGAAGVLFGAADPALGFYTGAAADPRGWIGPPAADFRANQAGFRVTADGGQVEFGLEPFGKRPVRFDLAARTLHILSPDTPANPPAAPELRTCPEISAPSSLIASPPASLPSRLCTSGTPRGIAPGGDATIPSGQALIPPRTAAPPDLVPRNWHNNTSPHLNGTPLTLSTQEIARCLAVAADGRSFLLGADWSLRRFDATGKPVWKTSVPGTVWGVNITAADNLAVVAYGDGTVRWHRYSDGVELLALFVQRDGQRWVAWTPGGYYMASSHGGGNGGEELIGWHINRGKDQAADFFAARWFRDLFERPDVVQQVLTTRDEAEALRQADAAAQRSPIPLDRDLIMARLPPVLEILEVLATPNDPTPSGDSITVRYRLRAPSGLPVRSVWLLLDGQAPTGEAGAGVQRIDAVIPVAGITQSLDVSVPPRDVELTLFAETTRGVVSEPARARLRWLGKAETVTLSR